MVPEYAVEQITQGASDTEDVRVLPERIVEPPQLVSGGLGSILLFTGVFRHLDLVAQLTLREISSRYRGSLLGSVWPFLQPLLLLGIYTFVFSVVFGARWSGIYGSDVVSYALVVFSGLVTFNIFAESVRTAPKLVLSNRNFVKRVVFPLEVLPVVQVAAAIVHAVAGLAVLLLGLLVVGAPIGWTALLLLVVWAGFAFFSLGVCYLVATISVFVRDLEPLVGIAVMGLFFGSAIFYPIDRLPDWMESSIRLVPTAAAVDFTRELLLLGQLPDPAAALGAGAVSVTTLVVGYACFMTAKGRFADAL